MEPADLDGLTVPGSVALSPSGRVAFGVSTVNLAEDRYDQTIWIEDDGTARRFTTGPSDLLPRWSPDGRKVAFLRKLGDVHQVAVMSVEGGEPEVVTDFELGLSAASHNVIQWFPDSERMLVLAEEHTSGWTDLDDEERKRRPLRVTRVPWRSDGRGWIADRRLTLYVIGQGEPRRLVDAEDDVVAPSLSPDGSKVLYGLSNRPHPALDGLTDLFEIDTAGGNPRPVGVRGLWFSTSYRSDGKPHAIGIPGSGWPGNIGLCRIEGDEVFDLTGPSDLTIAVVSGGLLNVVWRDLDAVVGIEDSGRITLASVSPDGAIESVVDGDLVVGSFDATADRLAYVRRTYSNPGEVFVVADDESQLTTFGNAAPKTVAPHHLRVESGGEDVDAWVYLPEGSGKVPLLLNIHGGPAAQYGFGFFDEFQVYAGAGYGVVACNPRGSSGRGQTFVAAVAGEGWGAVDVADVDAVVAEALAKFDRLDSQRPGIMGGSYGGFLTAWIIGHQSRWRSAVVERALLSWPSFAGTSDIGPYFTDSYAGEESWESWWEKSPLRVADRVTAPTLIIHSEKDHRCPIEQAEQYFTALVRAGVEAEMVRFPDEGHEMSRSGKPKHRVERFEAILDWHARHL